MTVDEMANIYAEVFPDRTMNLIRSAFAAGARWAFAEAARIAEDAERRSQGPVCQYIAAAIRRRSAAPSDTPPATGSPPAPGPSAG